MRDLAALFFGFLAGLNVGIWVCSNNWERISVKQGKSRILPRRKQQ